MAGRLLGREPNPGILKEKEGNILKQVYEGKFHGKHRRRLRGQWSYDLAEVSSFT